MEVTLCCGLSGDDFTVEPSQDLKSILSLNFLPGFRLCSSPSSTRERERPRKLKSSEGLYWRQQPQPWAGGQGDNEGPCGVLNSRKEFCALSMAVPAVAGS